MKRRVMLRTVGASAILLSIGCQSDGRVSVDGGGVPQDDAGHALVDAGTADAGPALRCNPSAPFGTPVELTDLEEAGADFYFVSSAWLNAAETQMIVTARPSFDDGGKLFLLERATRADPFGAPVAIAGVDVEGRSEWSGSLSADGLSLYFDIARREPYRATRASVQADFSEGERIAPSVSTDFQDVINVRSSSSGIYFEEQTSVSSTLMFLRDGEEFPEQILVAAGRVTGYSLSQGELTLYYSLVPVDELNAVLYRTTRGSTSETFQEGTPFDLEPIVSFNGGNNVQWVSDDECVLYVTVNKIDSFGSYPHEVVLRSER